MIPAPVYWPFKWKILIKSSFWKNKIIEIIDIDRNILKNDLFICLSNKKTEILYKNNNLDPCLSHFWPAEYFFTSRSKEKWANI